MSSSAQSSAVQQPARKAASCAPPGQMRASAPWIVGGFKTVVKSRPDVRPPDRVEYEDKLGPRVPCPLKWLDSFSMRNFTNATVFDNTLPVADGVMEIGTHVPVQELKAAMKIGSGEELPAKRGA